MPSLKRPRVLLLIPHLGGGGAERVAEILARSLDRNKYEVHLGLVTALNSDLGDDRGIETIHAINALRTRRSLLTLLRLIWSIRPSVILSGMAHLNLLILLLRPILPRRTRILVRQNGELSETLATGFHPRISRFIYGYAYRRADLVICQSEAMKQEIQREFHIAQTKLAVLPNPLDASFVRWTPETSEFQEIESGQHLIAIGRLAPEKGFDILLEAFAGLSSQFSGTRLTVIGSGACEASLKQLSHTLGIASRVCFSGYVSNPATFFPSASLFVLSSRTEGIPNALLEAAAAGLPIVTTPASTGLADLVANNEGVWLASEISAKALRIAMGSALAAVTPGRRYPHLWIRPFENARAIPAYEAEIDRVLESIAP